MTAFRKFFISVFILFNLLTMVRVHLPLNTPYFKSLYKPIDKYLSFFSIYQDWMMFSPNPARIDSFLTAVVHFTDGSQTTYEFPRPSRMSVINNHIQGEKFRKLVSEGIRRDDHSYMWQDSARFALKQVMDKTKYEKLPSKVSLFRHWDEVPDLNQQFRPHNATPPEYQKYSFYTYEVSNDQL